jgi:hypothetical protein
VLSWRDDLSLQVRGAFRGFEILSRGRGPSFFIDADEERLPELFIRGAGIYKAQLNAENPVGTMQSVEYALRSLDKAITDERERAARAEKMLGDFREQAGKPFEHEARLSELLVYQTELNAALDLDKGERQIAPQDSGEEGAPGTENEASAEAGTPSSESHRNNTVRRHREHEHRAPENKAAAPRPTNEPPGRKGFNPATGRKM